MMPLPRSVVRKGGSLYCRKKIAGKDHYIRLPAQTDAAFEAALAGALVEMERRRPATKFLLSINAANIKAWDQRSERLARAEPLPRWIVLLARETKKRAVRKRLPFELDPPALAQLARRAAGQCEVSGLVFDHERRSSGAWRPFAASIDRIDNALGYTPGNVRLVCSCVNAALNQWGDDVFWEMIYAASKRLGGKRILGGR